MRRPKLRTEIKIGVPNELHPVSQQLVQDFAAAMAAKLRLAETKYGYRAGWRWQDWETECRKHLREHLAKGDPLDVAIYCAFMWSRGWSTVEPHTEARCEHGLARNLCGECAVHLEVK